MRARLAQFVVLLGFCCFAATAHAAGADALLLTAEGRVEWQKVETAAWVRVETNHLFNAKDKVRTGLKSRATVRLANQTVVRMNQLTTVEIQPQVEGGKRALLDLREGAAFFYNRDAAAETTFRTPTASGAIRGTEFNLSVDSEGNTVLTMIDGEVDLSNALGEVRVISGEQAVAEPGRPIRKTAVLNAINVVQWALYYPAILDLSELGLEPDDAIKDSLSSYRQGALVDAVAALPSDRKPASGPELIYRAATLLFSGQVDEARAALDSLAADDAGSRRLADALRQLIAAVQFQDYQRSQPPELAAEWMAESYYQQSRGRLEEARHAARQAARVSPEFGFAWARLAEMEFSFGKTSAALEAVNRALNLTPRNGQALALRGFLFSAQNKRSSALDAFNEAIAADPALGNAWLGRGLSRIREGQVEAGRQDLQTATTLEPNRAILRSYIGKAHDEEGRGQLARKEFNLAKHLDPADPTSFLYSALLDQKENRLNEAVRDLATSQDLNDNRSLYRSRLLLDQDKAVRSANLASVYRDNGMTDTSFREASRSVNYDYGNYAAHLFLANSYDALRDPRQVNLRYETPWLSELFLANLLAPVDAGNLAQNISQQEYSRFFSGNRFGLISLTEYFSNGDWLQRASQFGNNDTTAYSIDVDYRSMNGWRPNNDSESVTGYLKVKHQLTPSDSILLQAIYYDFESGDVGQYYDQAAASQTQRVKERQEPLLFAGYHHEWNPGIHTLALVSRFDDTFLRSNPAGSAISLIRDPNFFDVSVRRSAIDYRSELEGYSAEVQQIWDVTKHNIIAGGRYQTAEADTLSNLTPASGGFFVYPALSQIQENDITRYSVYAYDHWQVFEPLLLIGGISYDRLEYPVNIDIAPITAAEQTREQISPKAGFILEPWKNGFFRGAYTRSLGGVFFDNSIRLEPVQVAGFTQAYRSAIPESVLGIVPGARMETFGLGFDQRLWRNTYFAIDGEILNSTADQTLGAYELLGPLTPAIPTSIVDQLDYHEKSLYLSVHQLVGDTLSLGAHYRMTDADLNHRFGEDPLSRINRDEEAILHQLHLYALYNLPCGFFSQFGGIWSQQSNRGYSRDIPGDDFWQFNAFAGYRFARRHAEVRLGVLNLTDRDYQLNPLTLYAELPRERTFYASLKLNF